MLTPIDEYFFRQNEPAKTCLQFLRAHILGLNLNINESWNYGMPFYYFNGKRFCYLWMHKKYRQPYLGVVEGKRIHHPDLIPEKRTKMKILLLNPAKDLPIRKINQILKQAMALSLHSG